MEKAYKFLKCGEDTQKGDEFFDVRANCWFKITGSYTVGICHSPVRREINVIEIPAIPEGFRELTQEDIDKNIKGEVKTLAISEKGLKWRENTAQTKYFILKFNLALIIKPAPKGLSRENFKQGMKMRRKTPVEFSSTGFFEALNEDYQVFDERKQAWIDCADYEG